MCEAPIAQAKQIAPEQTMKAETIHTNRFKHEKPISWEITTEPPHPPKKAV